MKPWASSAQKYLDKYCDYVKSKKYFYKIARECVAGNYELMKGGRIDLSEVNPTPYIFSTTNRYRCSLSYFRKVYPSSFHLSRTTQRTAKPRPRYSIYWALTFVGDASRLRLCVIEVLVLVHQKPIPRRLSM